MDYRPSLGAQRPAPPQRALSGGSYGAHTLPKRPPLPSRLSNVRSMSTNFVDLTSEGNRAGCVPVGGSQGVMVKSPEVIDLEDEEQRPAKRAKTEGGDFRAAGDQTQRQHVDKANEVHSGDALPSLPRPRPSAGRAGAYRRNRLGVEPGARKAHGIDPPTMATRVPPPRKILDFAPWSGSHQEDVMNEATIRNGYSDKATGTSQSETNTAKASIWPSLSQKNHAGLSALSYMYVAVMEKRQTLGKCTAPSTFKPPPRLAVQEAKRAKWLEDLADASVSLRRLSKTIPHGIKGKLLMEQCLAKFIPVQRAMWLVRGVGMHELRAFRRKGFNEAQAASGEIKWVREWTVNVTQFLEDVIAACGQPDWRKKMSYAIKLATGLYTERLMDMGYYLDWIVSGFRDSTTDQLPIWSIITQIHWKDITTFGRRGRALAEGILDHLHNIAEFGSRADTVLQTNLQKMVTVLAVTRRGCLILPRAWQKYSGLLSPASSLPGTPTKEVTRRNQRLAAPLDKTPQNTRSAYLDLYAALDSVELDLDLGKLTKICTDYLPESSDLVAALLGWASTRYRVGSWRIYLAAAIITKLQKAGHDTDSIILDYLASVKSMQQESEDQVYRVIIELVRMQAFSVGRYLQWLIASGALYEEHRSSATSLIAALPTDGLPTRIVNTRNMVMSRLGLVVDGGPAVASLAGKIGEHLASDLTSANKRFQLPNDLLKSTAYALSQQLLQKAMQIAEDTGLGLQHFCTVRDVFEQIGDMSSLVSLVSIAARSNIFSVLATAADTVSYHAHTFAALRQLELLVDQFGEQYLALRPHQPLDRTFIRALGDILKCIPGKGAMTKLLADDLVLLDQQTSMAACSPASDSVIDMHAASLESDEDLDAVFASGNVMDEQLMSRVFALAIQRADKRSAGTDLTRVCGWLEALQAVDASKVLEGIADKYVRSNIDAMSLEVTAALTVTGCTSLDKLASLAKDALRSHTAGRILGFITSPAERLGSASPQSYRFKLEQQRCQDEHSTELVKLTRKSLDTTIPGERADDVVRFLVRGVARQQFTLYDVFVNLPALEVVQENVKRLLHRINGRHSTAESDIIRDVIANASPLSVRFSTAVKYLPASKEGDASFTKDAILQAFEQRSDVWPQLLEIADDESIQALRSKAQEDLLHALARDTEHVLAEDIKRTLDMLAITNNICQKPDVAFIARVVECLRDVDRTLVEIDTHVVSDGSEKAGLLHRLDLILDLAALNIYAPEVDNDSMQQNRTSLLQTLCALLVNRQLQLHANGVEYVFDIAAILSDSLPETALLSIKLKLTPDARLDFILGNSPNGTEAWLALATPVQPPGATQQQRALARHPSSQQSQTQKNLPPRSSAAGPAAQRGWPTVASNGKAAAEVKSTPYQLRRWEMISDPASTVGENDTALSLGLFGTRKV